MSGRDTGVRAPRRTPMSYGGACNKPARTRGGCALEPFSVYSGCHSLSPLLPIRSSCSLSFSPRSLQQFFRTEIQV